MKKEKIIINNKTFLYSDNSVIFSNNRVEKIKWYDRLTKIDSPLLKFLIRIFTIIVEFFVIGFIVISITFFLINAVPGSNSITAGLSESGRKAVLHQYGLDLPVFARYINYIKGLFHGNLGISLALFPTKPINDFVWTRFMVSFYVGIASVALTILIGIPLGIWIGKNPNGIIDNISSIFVSLFSSVPSIIFALLLLFIGRLIGLPYLFDQNNLLTYILPTIALSLGSIIFYIKYIRTELNNELNSMHAKFAYLKGLSKSRFVWKHALKPALFPIATFFPAVIFGSFIGSIFIEQIFLIPGSGSLLLQAIQTKDYNVILFLIIVFALFTIFSYAARDILYEVIDPRVRRKGK